MARSGWAVVAALVSIAAAALGCGGKGGGGQGGGDGGSGPAPSLCGEKTTTPQRLFGDHGQIDSLAIGGTTLFVMTGSGLFAVPGCGGAEEVVDDHGFGGLAVEGDTVYWSAFGDNGSPNVKKRAVSGGAITMLAEAPDLYVNGLATDGKTVFVTQSNPSALGTTVRSIPVSGGTPAVLTQEDTGAEFHAIAVRAGTVYFTTFHEGEYVGSVRSVPATGGGAVTLASGGGWHNGLALDDTSIWFTSFDASDTLVSNVWKMPLAGGAAAPFATMQHLPESVAVDETDVYWTNIVGGLMKAPRAGGEPVLVHEPTPPGTRALALDARNVVWSTDSGEVLRLSK